MSFSDDVHFNNVQSWLESSSQYQSGDDFSEIQSDVSSNAHTSGVEPEFPSYVYNDAERKERMSNLWNSTGAIISDIQKCSDFSNGTVKLKKKHLAPKPVPEKEAEPLQKQHKERWNDFEYISNSIQGKKSPNRLLQNVNVAKAKTAQAWAAKPVASAKVNKGRGSLLIKTPESLSNLMEQIGAPSYQNHNIEDFINNTTGKFDDTDESDSESSYDAAGSKSLSSASGKDEIKAKSIPAANQTTKSTSGASRGPYIPPHRRSQLAKTAQLNVKSQSSRAHGAEQRCPSLLGESNKVKEMSHLAPNGKNSNGASPEFVQSSNVGAMKKLCEEKSNPLKEQKKPFFSLLAKTTLPVGVVARRNPTVLKLVEKMSVAEVTPNSETNFDKSSCHIGENSTFSQLSEENASEAQYVLASRSAEKISSGSKTNDQKNVVESPKSKIPSVYNPGEINPNQLYSKLSELKRLQNEVDEADNLDSPDSCINDHSENSELELEWNEEEEEDTGGYSSGFSDNMADGGCTVERAPASELTLVTIPCDDDNYCNDDFYNRSLPAYYLQREHSSGHRNVPHRVSSGRPDQTKSFTLNQEDFPKL